MNKTKTLFSLVLVAAFSVVLVGCGKGEKPMEDGINKADVKTEKATEEIKSGLPITVDAKKINMNTETITNFQSKMTTQELYDFYKAVVPAMGYTEREITTVIKENVLNLVFDANNNEKTIVVQATPFGDGVTNVNIRYE